MLIHYALSALIHSTLSFTSFSPTTESFMLTSVREWIHCIFLKKTTTLQLKLLYQFTIHWGNFSRNYIYCISSASFLFFQSNLLILLTIISYNFTRYFLVYMHFGTQRHLMKGTSIVFSTLCSLGGDALPSAQLCKDSRALAGLRECWEASWELLKCVCDRGLVIKWSPYSWGTKGFFQMIFLRHEKMWWYLFEQKVWKYNFS